MKKWLMVPEKMSFVRQWRVGCLQLLVKKFGVYTAEAGLLVWWSHTGLEQRADAGSLAAHSSYMDARKQFIYTNCTSRTCLCSKQNTYLQTTKDSAQTQLSKCMFFPIFNRRYYLVLQMKICAHVYISNIHICTKWFSLPFGRI